MAYQKYRGQAKDAWAGWCNDTGGNVDKVWAGAVRGVIFRYSHGRRGSDLVTGFKQFANEGSAKLWLWRKIEEKMGHGYVEVPFGTSPTYVPHPFASVNQSDLTVEVATVESDSPEDIRRRMRLALEDAKKEGLLDG